MGFCPSTVYIKNQRTGATIALGLLLALAAPCPATAQAPLRPNQGVQQTNLLPLNIRGYVKLGSTGSKPTKTVPLFSLVMRTLMGVLNGGCKLIA